MVEALAIHRCRFLEYNPSGVVCLAAHPSGEYMAVAREDGSVELWATSSAGTDEGALPWIHISTIVSSANFKMQTLLWTQARSDKVSSFEGARLFSSSLSGQIFECNWTTLAFQELLDSYGGGVWSVSAFELTKAGLPGWSGIVLACGCEDGSVRLFHVSGESSTTRSLCVCPGVDGRILSLSWHPQYPALFAGTSMGTVRGWDMSSIFQSLVTVLGANLKNSESRQKRVRSSDSESSDSESNETNLSTELLLRGGAGPRSIVQFQVATPATSRRGSKLRAAPIAHTDSQAHIWSLVVLSDNTILTGDAKGEVNSWDATTGVRTSSIPILTFNGDVFSLSASEAKKRVILTAGDSTGTVSVAVRAQSDGENLGKWVIAGTVPMHSSHIRSTFVLGNQWIVSGSADSGISVLRAAGFASNATGGGEDARHLTTLNDGSILGRSVSISSSGMLAVYESGEVRVWRLPGSLAPITKLDEKNERKEFNLSRDPTLLLSVTPSLASTGTGLADASSSAAVLFSVNKFSQKRQHGLMSISDLRRNSANSSAPVAISSDAQFLAFACSQAPCVRVLRLERSNDFISEDESSENEAEDLVRPVPVELIGFDGISGVTLLRFVQVPSSTTPGDALTYLIVVTAGTIHIALASIEEEDCIRWLFSIPVPAGVPAQQIHMTAHRSSTSSSSGAGSLPDEVCHALDSSSRRSNSFSAQSVDSMDAADDGVVSDDAKTVNSHGSNGSSLRKYRKGQIFSTALVLHLDAVPFFAHIGGSKSERETTNSSKEGDFLIAVATTTRRIHVFRCNREAATLATSIPLLPQHPSAIALTPSSHTLLAKLVVVLQGGAISVFNALGGRLMPWSPTFSDTRNSVNKALISRCGGDRRKLAVGCAITHILPFEQEIPGISSNSTGLIGPLKLLLLAADFSAVVTFSTATSLLVTPQDEGMKSKNAKNSSKRKVGEKLANEIEKEKGKDVLPVSASNANAKVSASILISERRSNVLAAARVDSNLASPYSNRMNTSKNSTSNDAAASVSSSVVIAEISSRKLAAQVGEIRRKKFGRT